MLLEVNGKRNSSKHVKALDVRCFFVADQREKGDVSIMWCPPEDMEGDCHA